MSATLFTMNWTTITENDLLCALNKNQLDLLKSEAMHRNDTSMCVKVIELVVSRIRAEIAASGINMLDKDYAKIPLELKDCALKLAIEALQTRMDCFEISSAQQRAADNAREILARVASGKLPVSRPRNGIKTARKHSIAYGGSQRKITRNTTESI